MRVNESRGEGMNFRLTLLVAGTLFVAGSYASETGKGVKYVPPTGFGGHVWGEPRKNFDRLPEVPVGVGAAWMRAIQKQTDFQCVPNVQMNQAGATDLCNFQDTLLRLRTQFDGGGVYVLSEFSIADQGFRYGDGKDGVVLAPVVYQFCANWQGNRKSEAPAKFDDLNRFCGMKFEFQSETREQLRKLPDNYVTAYDRVLEKLLAKYGRPAGFLRRGQVIIETVDGDSSDPGDRRFSIWRWCPATGDGLHTECTASVTLSLNPTTGQGTVLYSTPLLWEFAYARENNGFKGDPLFRLLHARN
jgi:hypothetical protein